MFSNIVHDEDSNANVCSLMDYRHTENTVHAWFDKLVGIPFLEQPLGTIEVSRYSVLGRSWTRTVSTIRAKYVARTGTVFVEKYWLRLNDINEKFKASHA